MIIQSSLGGVSIHLPFGKKEAEHSFVLMILQQLSPDP